MFLGTVLVADDSGAGDVVFQVLAAWKGVDKDTNTLALFSAPLEGCTFRFQEGRTYLVYAQDGSGYFFDLPGELVTDACSRTVDLEHANEDLAKLRPPKWMTRGGKKLLSKKEARVRDRAGLRERAALVVDAATIAEAVADWLTLLPSLSSPPPARPTTPGTRPATSTPSSGERTSSTSPPPTPPAWRRSTAATG